NTGLSEHASRLPPAIAKKELPRNCLRFSIDFSKLQLRCASSWEVAFVGRRDDPAHDLVCSPSNTQGLPMNAARWAIAVVLFAALAAHSQTISQPASAWPTASAVASGLSDARLQALDAAVRSGEFKKIGSVLVARHGKLVYEAYFDGDTTTLRDTRSATKSITDVLVGIAIDEHKLSGVDAKILTLLPERARKLQNPDPRKSAITVEDFLTMSSPLECDDWNDASRGNEERMYVVEDWAQFILDLPIRGRMHVGEQVEAPPYGRYFSYCTGGVFTLSEVLEKVTGARTDRYAREKLFQPLGITNLEWVYSPMNVPQTGGGLRMTSRDLLKIAQLYLDGGESSGRGSAS
ncbi:MAG: serine hydrolase, partial [Terriglobales bacterium]